MRNLTRPSPSSQALIAADETTAVRSLNDAAFARVLLAHPSIFIRTSEAADWRPCNQAVLGLLTGLEHLGELRALLTDGCVAWFLGRDGQLTHGHVASFHWLAPLGGRQEGAPPQPFTVERATGRSPEGESPRRPSGPRKNGRSTTYSLAMELLK